jgi:hypothetical protein
MPRDLSGLTQVRPKLWEAARGRVRAVRAVAAELRREVTQLRLMPTDL